MIKAFLFDLDGTLIDSERHYVQACHRAYQERGCNISVKDVYTVVYGRPAELIYKDLSVMFPNAFPSFETAGNAMRKHYLDIRGTSDLRIHNSVQLLKTLAKDHRVAVVSGSPAKDVAEAIGTLEIEQYLEFFFSIEDYSEVKPDPACYLMAAERLQLKPQQCLVFEDSAVGVNAAKNAGMFCIALKQHQDSHQELSIADQILEDLADFRMDLLGINVIKHE